MAASNCLMCFLVVCLSAGQVHTTDSSYAIPENKRFSGAAMFFEFIEAKYGDDIYK
ncbi:hypothetical protein BaRGS_00003993, partial [Batillaria attramentaria]